MNKKQISKLLIQLGVNPAYKGYTYLVNIIHLAVNDKDQPIILVKTLYAKTAKQFNVSTASVQRNVWALLKSYWVQDTPKYFYEVMKYPVRYSVTTKEFIAVIVDHIRINRA